MQDFKKLKVWEKSHQLTLALYKLTEVFPKSEQFGITQQLKRAASSIPANIAEGCCRNSSKEFAQFLQISMGSASEVKYFLILCKDLEYIKLDDFETLVALIDEIMKMLSVFINKLRSPLKTNN